MTDTTNKPSFIELLTELAEFKDYFTEDDHIDILVKWLQEETGVSKMKATFAVKHIAPFVVSCVEKLVGTLANSWKAKLHERLSRYGDNSWYYRLSENILNILKTRTDKSLDLALQVPTEDNLLALLEDKVSWSNLKAEQQGLIQLLSGQTVQKKQLSEIQSSQSDQTKQLNQVQSSQVEQLSHLEQIIQLIQAPTFQLDLKTPDYLQSLVDKNPPEKGTARWLTYTARQAKLVGRETELNLLDEFFNQDKTFSWWAVTGQGGVGKSRLALEALIKQSLWYGGFVPEEKLKTVDALSRWQPTCPTILVIDYAAKYPETVAGWIDHLQQHQDSYDFPVRLLLLEREFKEQDWWKTLLPGSSTGLARQTDLFQVEPFPLQSLTVSDQKEALTQFLIALGKKAKLPKDSSDFWNTLHDLSEEGRPLFIAMTAVALANGNRQGMTNWNHNDLLDFVYNHEQNCWDNILKAVADKKDIILKLLTVNTLVSGFDWNDEDNITDQLITAGVLSETDDLQAYWSYMETLAGHDGGYIQPDLFAEYCLLKRLPLKRTGPGTTTKNLLKAAYKIDSVNMLDTLARTALDYSDDQTSWFWWDYLNSQNSAEEGSLHSWAFYLVGRMDLAGKYKATIQFWLPPLVESADIKTRSQAIGWLGHQHLSTSNYNTALTYLKQSLAIRKEIGDKSGEGTTLNNISQIYDARGDYETALTYLKQSLAIRKEIGDQAGLCATLFNIGHIYMQNEEVPEAMSAWLSVYAMAKEMSLAQVLQALENLADQFGLPDDAPTGLDFWQMLLEQSEAENAESE